MMITALEAAPAGGDLLGALAAGGRVPATGAGSTKGAPGEAEDFTGLLAAACAALGMPVAGMTPGMAQTGTDSGPSLGGNVVAPANATTEVSAGEASDGPGDGSAAVVAATPSEGGVTPARTAAATPGPGVVDPEPSATVTAQAVGQGTPEAKLGSTEAVQVAGDPAGKPEGSTRPGEAAAPVETTQTVDAAGLRVPTAAGGSAKAPAAETETAGTTARATVRVPGVRRSDEETTTTPELRQDARPAAEKQVRRAEPGQEVRPGERTSAPETQPAQEPVLAAKATVASVSPQAAEERRPAKTARLPAGNASPEVSGGQNRPAGDGQTPHVTGPELAPESGKGSLDGKRREATAPEKASLPGEERSAETGSSESKERLEWPGEGLRSSAAEQKPAEPVAAERPSARAEVRELPQFVRRAELVARAGGPAEMRVQLVPEHLGRLSIRISVSEGGVTARLVVENAQVKSMVEARLPELEKALREQGLRLDGLSVGCQGSEAEAGGFLRQQAEEQLARGFAAGAARRGYEDGLPAAVPEGLPTPGGRWWPGDGGLINALM